MKILAWIVGVCVALFVIVSAVLLNPPDPMPRGEVSEARLAAGPHEFIEESFSLVDASRGTQANGDQPALDTRSFEGWLLYPEGAGPWPVLIYSHGFGGNKEESRFLLEHLASHGYVVAAVDFPLTNTATEGTPLVFDVSNQPADVSFLLDTMLDRAGDSADALYGKIDVERVGFLGLSLGGLTTTLATFHRDLRDSRVDVAISIAGPSSMFLPRFFEHADVPFMMLAGTADAIVPFQPNAADIPDRVVNSVLVSLERGTHLGFVHLHKTFIRFVDHPDGLACPFIVEQLEENAASRVDQFFPEDADVGIGGDEFPPPCADADLDPAMSVIDQQMLTQLAVRAFMDLHLSTDAAVRAEAARFLASEFAEENPDVAVRESVPVEQVLASRG